LCGKQNNGERGHFQNKKPKERRLKTNTQVLLKTPVRKEFLLRKEGM